MVSKCKSEWGGWAREGGRERTCVCSISMIASRRGLQPDLKGFGQRLCFCVRHPPLTRHKGRKDIFFGKIAFPQKLKKGGKRDIKICKDYLSLPAL